MAEDLDLDLGSENDLVLECSSELDDKSKRGVSFFINVLPFILEYAPLKSSGIDCLEELEFLPFAKRPFMFVLHFFSEFLIVVLLEEEEEEVKYEVVLAFLNPGIAPYLGSLESWIEDAIEFASEFASDTEPFLEGAKSKLAG